MFDGVPEQFHQFIAPRTTSSLPLHLSFPLHPNSNAFPPTPFDAYNYNNTHLPLLHQPNLLHPNHYSPTPTLTSTHKHYQHKDSSMTNLQEMNEREASQLPDLVDSCTWTHDEVLALFRIRSTMDTTWFPDLTWEHVSRKLAEVGFKRSAEKCKEKFEEESRYLNNINYNDNYRFLSEQLEQDLYQPHDHQPPPEVGSEKERERQEEEEEEESADLKTTSSEEPKYSRHDTSKSKERKRKKVQDDDDDEDDDEFEMLKGFCENIVNKMMAQQEEMHNKLLEDMVKRDGEKFAREEAWKKQEIERMNKELQMMAQEQVEAGDRQATVIEFLKKFTATSNNTSTCSPCPHSQNPNHFNNNNADHESMKNKNIVKIDDTTAAAENPIAQKPSSVVLSVNSVSTCTWSSSGKGDNSSVGRRWPRDEVLALINLRCSDHQEKELGNNKAPLWERISQGMSDLGYKRSAKRCKEKWENINKYFRKTKDINKKRSLHSRTCPYFHQLTTLYTQGKLIASQTHSHPPPHPHSG